MSAITWGDFEMDEIDPCKGKAFGTTENEFIEVAVQYFPGKGAEFQVSIWHRQQSTKEPASHNVIGKGNAARGRQVAEELLNEGLERF